MALELSKKCSPPPVQKDLGRSQERWRPMPPATPPATACSPPAKSCNDGCNTAAEAVAAKVTQATGRETTASEVKKGRRGRRVSPWPAPPLLRTSPRPRAAVRPSLGRAPSARSPGRNSGVGNGDVMDEAYKFFARNGSSLNIETHTIDMDGCILDCKRGISTCEINLRNRQCHSEVEFARSA